VGGYGRCVVIGDRCVSEPEEGEVREVYRYVDDPPPFIAWTRWGRSLMSSSCSDHTFQAPSYPSPSLWLIGALFPFLIFENQYSFPPHARATPISSLRMLIIIICAFFNPRLPRTLIIYSICIASSLLDSLTRPLDLNVSIVLAFGYSILTDLYVYTLVDVRSSTTIMMQLSRGAEPSAPLEMTWN